MVAAFTDSEVDADFIGAAGARVGASQKTSQCEWAHKVTLLSFNKKAILQEMENCPDSMQVYQ